MAHDERRRAPRIDDAEVALELHAGDFDMMAHTLNISASGLDCKVDREMPIMSRINLMLMIPDSSAGARGIKKVEVEGVVVRAHPVIIDGEVRHYDVAIFFDNLSPKAKELIASYIARKKGAQDR